MTTVTVAMVVERAIRADFPGKSNAGLRAELRAAAESGSVMSRARRVALTYSGQRSLEAVQAAIDDAR